MPKYAKRRDIAEPAIVQALEATGCTVYRELPCDLLVRRPRDPPGILRTLECKTPTKSGKRRKRKDQEAQDKFIEATGTPVVLTAEQALGVLGLSCA